MYTKIQRYIHRCIQTAYAQYNKYFPATIERRSKKQEPVRVSIITSVYKGEQFIEQFLDQIVQQTIFSQCELIMINAYSPGNEEPVILRYMQQHSNIVYVKLGYDPGLYAVWNLGVKMARGHYITNANLDDRVRNDCYQLHAQALDANPTIDLVYSDIYITHRPNETLTSHSAIHKQESPEFSPANMRMCLPNDHPMWRKSLHEKYGYFDERYIMAGDYEMWLRAVAQGAQFKKVHGILGLHYVNPCGLSTDTRNPRVEQEAFEVKEKYKFLWEEN